MKRHIRNIIDGKEITLSLEDALMSSESLRFMLGGAIRRASTEKQVEVSLTEQVTVAEDGVLPEIYDHLNTEFKYEAPTNYRFLNLTQGSRGNQDSIGDVKKGDILRVMWKVMTTSTDAAVEITISPNTFPGLEG